MSWQDLVFAVASITFSLALIPAMFSRSKPPRSTCLLTAIPLWAFVPTEWSLGLRYATVTGAVTALFWTILLFQRRRENPS